jgi:DNA-binding XRE family transcriptional regulator
LLILVLLNKSRTNFVSHFNLKYWTQADLATALEVSQQTINAIDNGQFDQNLPQACKAA